MLHLCAEEDADGTGVARGAISEDQSADDENRSRSLSIPELSRIVKNAASPLWRYGATASTRPFQGDSGVPHRPSTFIHMDKVGLAFIEVRLHSEEVTDNLADMTVTDLDDHAVVLLDGDMHGGAATEFSGLTRLCGESVLRAHPSRSLAAGFRR